MKRFLTIVFTGILLFSGFIGCSSKEDPNRASADKDEKSSTRKITSLVEKKILMANTNAKTLHIAANSWATDMNIDGIPVLFDTIYECDDRNKTTGTDGCDLIEGLGDDFEGYWLFKTNENGEYVMYALYSEAPIEHTEQMTSEEQEQYYIETGRIIGCYPLND